MKTSHRKTTAFPFASNLSFFIKRLFVQNALKPLCFPQLIATSYKK